MSVKESLHSSNWFIVNRTGELQNAIEAGSFFHPEVSAYIDWLSITLWQEDQDDCDDCGNPIWNSHDQFKAWFDDHGMYHYIHNEDYQKRYIRENQSSNEDANSSGQALEGSLI